MTVHRTTGILLVEDDPRDAELTIRALRKHNLADGIVVARDGAEALDMLFGNHDTQPVTPSVVVLDLKLPKIDGVEVLRQIRADDRTRLLPVVVLTSSRQETDLVRSYELGANSYIVKPVDFDEFIDAVKDVGLYWLLLNQPPTKISRGDVS